MSLIQRLYSNAIIYRQFTITLFIFLCRWFSDFIFLLPSCCCCCSTFDVSLQGLLLFSCPAVISVATWWNSIWQTKLNQHLKNPVRWLLSNKSSKIFYKKKSWNETKKIFSFENLISEDMHFRTVTIVIYFINLNFTISCLKMVKNNINFELQNLIYEFCYKLEVVSCADI